MATPVNNALLFNIFAGTLSPDKSVREAAEQALGELSSQHADLVLHLLRFCCEAIPSTDGSTGSSILSAQQAATSPVVAQQRNVLLAAAIRVRNVLGRSDWNRNPYFTEAVKLEVRQVIVPMQCQAHVSEHVRRQLLDTTKELMTYDYPGNWPGLIPQLNNLLDGWVAALRSALQATGHDSSSDPVASVILQLKGGLGVLRACCKIYEDPLRVDASAVDRFANAFLPSLVSLSETLFELWRQELHRLWQHPHSCDPPGLGNLFEFTPILTELSHCLRLIVKCTWSFVSARMPKCLCSEQAFQGFWQTCFAAPLAAIHEAYLPMCRARLQEQVHLPGAAGDALGDHYAIFQDSAVWKYVKWIYQMSYKLTQEFMNPKSCEKRVRAVATGFRDANMLPVVQYALELVRWHACPTSGGSSPATNGEGGSSSPVVLLTSKAYIMALEVLTAAVGSAAAYTSIVHPAAEELMTGLLFPRLGFSYEDAELWQFNPEEYVRKQSSPVGDLFSAKVVSASCLLSLAVPAAKFQDAGLLGSLVNFLMNQLQIFTPLASQAVSEEQSGPAAMDAARRVDAALFCMFQFKKVLAEMQLGDDKLELVLTSFVVPATRYPLGFLRARAVLVLSVFAPSIEWSSPQAYQAALQSVLPLLSDAETPVRVQTCASFSRLIRHPHARAVVTPCIAQLIQHYFDVMRLMDNEAVIRTLRKTITYYHDSLAQWGLELTDMLVSHFQTVLQNVSARYNALESGAGGGAGAGAEGGMRMSDCLEDDGFADVLMAADELLDTLTTLVKALPTHTEDTEENIFAQLQYRISPMLYIILSHQGGSTYGFMDPVLMLLTTLLSRSPRVVEPTWRLVPCLHQLILVGGAVDYFGQMLAPLDNYVSVAPQPFFFSPLGALCGADVSTATRIPHEMLAKTPMQLVQEMAAGVLQSTSLRRREVASVPKLYDSMMQNLWVLRKTVGEGDAQPQPPVGAPEALVTSSTQQLLYYLGSGPLSQPVLSTTSTAAGRKKRSRVSVGTGTLRVLFANAIFSCVLAAPSAAMQTLAAFHATASFYEQYVLTVLGSSHCVTAGEGNQAKAASARRSGGGGVLACLRRYDRRVFVLSFCETVQLLAHASAWSETHEVLVATLASVVQTGVLETFAAEERVASEGEAAFLEKRAARMGRRQKKAAHAPPPQGTAVAAEDHPNAQDDDDEDEWEDDDDNSSGFDDDEGCGGSGGDADDDDEWEEDEDSGDEGGSGAGEGGGRADLGFGSEDAAYFTQDKKLQAMLREAQVLRGGGGSGKGRQGTSAAGADDDVYEDVVEGGNVQEDGDALDDADDDNLLDEEDEDFVSPVDAVNVWAVLLDDVVHPYSQQQQPLPPPVAALVEAVMQHGQGGVFQRVRGVVDRLMAARAAMAAAVTTR